MGDWPRRAVARRPKIFVNVVRIASCGCRVVPRSLCTGKTVDSKPIVSPGSTFLALKRCIAAVFTTQNSSRGDRNKSPCPSVSGHSAARPLLGNPARRRLCYLPTKPSVDAMAWRDALPIVLVVGVALLSQSLCVHAGDVTYYLTVTIGFWSPDCVQKQVNFLWHFFLHGRVTVLAR